MAKNLAEGNQWLEESALENDTTREHNFLPPENSSHKFDLEEEENSIQKDNPSEQHNPSQQKSNTKRPLEGTGEENARRTKYIGY